MEDIIETVEATDEKTSAECTGYSGAVPEKKVLKNSMRYKGR